MANYFDDYEICEKAELERLIGELTFQNLLKDRQIERLSWDQAFYIDEVSRLEKAIKSIGGEEEVTFRDIIKTSQRDISFTEAAINKAIDMVSELLNYFPVEEYAECVPVSDHLRVLAKALSKIEDLTGDISSKVRVFFHMRHYMLKREGLGSLLAEKPLVGYPKGEDSDDESEDSKDESDDEKEGEEESKKDESRKAQKGEGKDSQPEVVGGERKEVERRKQRRSARGAVLISLPKLGR